MCWHGDEEGEDSSEVKGCRLVFMRVSVRSAQDFEAPGLFVAPLVIIIVQDWEKL